MPTAVPPLLQSAGGVGCGPNTVKLIVPPAWLYAPDRAAVTALAAIAVPAVPLAGADTVVLVGAAAMTGVMVTSGVPVVSVVIEVLVAPGTPEARPAAACATIKKAGVVAAASAVVAAPAAAGVVGITADGRIAA